MRQTAYASLLGLASASPVLTAPNCPKPDDTDVNWLSCQLDTNAWYGISYASSYTQATAEQTCSDLGGELISILDQTIDQCAFYTMSLTQYANTFVMYSGHYLAYQEKWAWCPNYSQTANGDVPECYADDWTYTNWQVVTSGDCMGGEFLTSTPEFKDYTWYKKDCNEMRAKFMCRVSCAAEPSPTPTANPTAEPTGAPSTTIEPATTTMPAPITGQYFAVANSESLYMYDIENGEVNPKNNVRFLYSIPYLTNGQPHLAFNEELKAIELAGDWNKAHNKNHGYFLLDGVWQPDESRLSDGRYHSAMIHCSELGTVLIGGSNGDEGTSKTTIQLYRPSTWSIPPESFEFPWLNHGRTEHSALYHQQALYVAGGSGEYLEMLDIAGVSDYSDLTDRSWILLPDLQTHARRTNLHGIGNNLYYFGDAGRDSESKYIEVYDLTTGNSTVTQNVFQDANSCAASFITENNQLTVIGGDNRNSRPGRFDSSEITESGSLGVLDFQYIKANIADSLGGAKLAFANIYITEEEKK